MTSSIGKLPLACLITIFLSALLFADEVQFNVSPVQKLADYQYNFPSESLIPGLRYNGSILARWAISDAALSGLEGRSIVVKVSASASNNSSVFFLSPLGLDSYETEGYLRCDVENSACANSSILSVELPVVVFVHPDSPYSEPTITVRSEIAEGLKLPEMGASAGGIFDSIAKALAGNQSNGSQNDSNGSGLFTGSPFETLSGGNSTEGNLLDSLKPEGNPQDPIEFLRQNQLVSIMALAIVVVITGAYLLNSKD